jgi:hypothetical protein
MKITININIDDKIVGFFKRLLNRRVLSRFLFLTIIIPIAIYAADTPTYVDFSAGEVVSASEINTRFQALYDAAWNSTATGVNTGDLYYTAGKVGIGTDAPKLRLQVNGSVHLEAGASQLRFQETDTIDENYRSYLNSGRLRFQTCNDAWDTCSNTLYLYSDNSAKFFSDLTIAGKTNFTTWEQKVAKGTYSANANCTAGKTVQFGFYNHKSSFTAPGDSLCAGFSKFGLCTAGETSCSSSFNDCGGFDEASVYIVCH